jgi:hypothetical protein
VDLKQNPMSYAMRIRIADLEDNLPTQKPKGLEMYANIDDEKVISAFQGPARRAGKCRV